MTFCAWAQPDLSVMHALIEPFRHGAMAGVAVVAAAAALTGLLIVWLRPWLVRYAMARPNARSSHRTPTPQGGGIAVIGSFVVVSILAMLLSGQFSATTISAVAAAFGAAILIAVLGAVDDIRPIAVVPRLAIQILAVSIVILSLPAEFQMTPFLPWWLERIMLILAGTWFVNLVNFMDGLDWMTVAEFVPLTAGLVLLGATGALPPYAIVCALALLGALIGFAPFNRPVARLFLGDVGSLPIGLIIGWLLALLADKGHLAAAILLPLYYLVDATVTLIRRLAKGERVWQAHRTHFYQRATDNGFSVRQVIARVFIVNILLVVLAAICVRINTPIAEIAALAAGAAIVGSLLMRFSRRLT
ncbi:MAG TPA: glycosyltransferase family 4 protein [Pseudorhodoplanes sp.]|nr:glycosyltransferase family 4 protein [Pseudorhodoplanes sp.]HWV54451.1 glycosyltransferase family 4 protein [Pseudorhodoplanes sp.]